MKRRIITLLEIVICIAGIMNSNITVRAQDDDINMADIMTEDRKFVSTLVF